MTEFNLATIAVGVPASARIPYQPDKLVNTALQELQRDFDLFIRELGVAL